MPETGSQKDPGDSKKYPAKAKVRAPRPVLKTPAQWRDDLGTSVSAFAYCDILHGWSKTAEQFVAEPMALSEQDYKSALEASRKHDEKGRACVHPPAVGKAVRDRRAGVKEEEGS